MCSYLLYLQPYLELMPTLSAEYHTNIKFLYKFSWSLKQKNYVLPIYHLLAREFAYT